MNSTWHLAHVGPLRPGQGCPYLAQVMISCLMPLRAAAAAAAGKEAAAGVGTPHVVLCAAGVKGFPRPPPIPETKALF